MSRTRRQYAAYTRTGLGHDRGTEVLFEHSGDKYDLAGLMQNRDGSWSMVALGASRNSVASRTRAIARKSGAWWTTADVFLHTVTATTWEVTAPVVRDYFGSHVVLMTQGFHPERGWENWTDGNRARKAGKSRIRALAREGYTAISFRQGGRAADFQMDELLKSMNTGKKAS